MKDKKTLRAAPRKKKPKTMKEIFAKMPNRVGLWSPHNTLALDNPAKYKAQIKKKYGCEPEPRLYHPIGLDWTLEGIGFGGLCFYEKRGKIYCANECMSRESVKHILGILVDQSIFDDERRPKRVTKKGKA